MVAVGDDGGEFRLGQHGARGVGRAGDDQAVERSCGGDRLRGRHVPGLGTDPDADEVEPERSDHVAVGGVAWFGDTDALALVESGQQRQQHPARRTDGDGDPVRRHGNTVRASIVDSDALAQLVDPGRGGVPEPILLNGSLRRLPGSGGSRGHRLTHLQVEHVAHGRLTRCSRLHHLHDEERGDLRPARGLHGRAGYRCGGAATASPPPRAGGWGPGCRGACRRSDRRTRGDDPCRHRCPRTA